jgi:hypothetical protein
MCGVKSLKRAAIVVVALICFATSADTREDFLKLIDRPRVGTPRDLAPCAGAARSLGVPRDDNSAVVGRVVPAR